MKAVKTAQSNHNFGPPKGYEDRVGDLPCQLENDGMGIGVDTVWSVWELDDADREAIANGWNIRLGVGWIGGFPPVSVGVTHEQAVKDDG